MRRSRVEVISARQASVDKFLPSGADALHIIHIVVADLVCEERIVGPRDKCNAKRAQTFDDRLALFAKTPPSLNGLITPATDKNDTRSGGDAERGLNFDTATISD